MPRRDRRSPCRRRHFRPLSEYPDAYSPSAPRPEHAGQDKSLANTRLPEDRLISFLSLLFQSTSAASAWLSRSVERDWFRIVEVRESKARLPASTTRAVSWLDLPGLVVRSFLNDHAVSKLNCSELEANCWNKLTSIRKVQDSPDSMQIALRACAPPTPRISSLPVRWRCNFRVRRRTVHIRIAHRSAWAAEHRRQEPMSDEELIPLFMPSLLVLLAHDEAEKGSPLTREEVFAIRDQAATVTLDRSVANQIMSRRGYKDINSDFAYEEWQAVRTVLKEFQSPG